MRAFKLGFIAMVLAVVALTTAAAGGGTRPGARSLRWDFIDVNLSAKQITPGGADTSKDDATGDTLTLTGSGQFTPSRRVASGGGTFVHKHADGTVFAQG